MRSFALPRSSSPASIQRPEFTQAQAMRQRGDLFKSTLRFNVKLSRPGAHARAVSAGSRVSRLGMDVQRDLNPDREQLGDERLSRMASRRISHQQALRVVDVDQSQSQATPVAEWNLREQRCSNRGPDERRPSLAIKSGDHIRAVNGKYMDDDALFSELVNAASIASPKALNLSLERLVSDVMEPSSLICGKLATLELELAEVPSSSRRSSAYGKVPSYCESTSTDSPSIPGSARSSRSSSSSEKCLPSSSAACGDRRRVRFNLVQAGLSAVDQPCRSDAPRSIQKLLQVYDV